MKNVLIALALTGLVAACGNIPGNHPDLKDPSGTGATAPRDLGYPADCGVGSYSVADQRATKMPCPPHDGAGKVNFPN